MDRRDFLKAAVAVPAAAALPLGALTTVYAPLTLAALRAAEARAVDYYAFIHPSCWYDIRRFVARDLWRLEYSAWRKTVRAGAQVETLQEVMERVALEAESNLRIKTAWTEKGEVGSYEGFRFIESEKVAA